MNWKFNSIEEWRSASIAKDEHGEDCGLVGLSPTGTAEELKTSQQRVHHLIRTGYLDGILIYERGRLMVIMVTYESIKRFKELPNPKPGPKQKVTIPEILKWAGKLMYEELRSGKSMKKDDNVAKWLNSTPEGREFRMRMRDRFGPVVHTVQDKDIEEALKLELLKGEE